MAPIAVNRADPAPSLSINMRGLEALVAVARTGSMTLAARELGMTQPAVSHAIRQLERSLGAELFDRRVRPPVLTLAGNAIVAHAIDVIERMRALKHALQFADERALPLLRIGMVDSFATLIGPHLVRELRDIATRWSVGSGLGETRVSALIERRVDFIVTSDEEAIPKEVSAIELLSEPFFLVMPADYKAEEPTLRKLAADLDLIRYRHNLYIAHQIEAILAQMSIEAAGRFQLDTVGAVLAMVEGGLGWTMVTPLGYLRGGGSSRKFRCTPLPARLPQRHLRLLSRKDESLAIAVRLADASIEMLRRHFVPAVEAHLPELKRHIRLGGKPI